MCIVDVYLILLYFCVFVSDFDQCFSLNLLNSFFYFETMMIYLKFNLINIFPAPKIRL